MRRSGHSRWGATPLSAICVLFWNSPIFASNYLYSSYLPAQAPYRPSPCPLAGGAGFYWRSRKLIPKHFTTGHDTTHRRAFQDQRGNDERLAGNYGVTVADSPTGRRCCCAALGTWISFNSARFSRLRPALFSDLPGLWRWWWRQRQFVQRRFVPGF